MIDVSEALQNKIKSHFSQLIEKKLMENSDFEQSDGIRYLIKYHTHWTKGEISTFRSLVINIVNELMKKIPKEFLLTSITEIKSKCQNENESKLFDVSVDKPIVMSVSFKVTINGHMLIEQKLRLEIKPEGSFKFEIKIEDKTFCMYSFTGKLSLSILDVPFMKLTKPIEIVADKNEVCIDFTEPPNIQRCYGYS